MQVPYGKTLYIGGRKFMSGENIPSNLAPFLNFKEEIEPEPEILIEPVKPKRKYRKRKK